eukprot:COSAG02_NODE_1244_length_13677_cov_50.752246_7_plen_126_part_00
MPSIHMMRLINDTISIVSNQGDRDSPHGILTRSMNSTLNLVSSLPNCAYCARFGVSTCHWFLSARNLSLNFFGTDCAQVANFLSCPSVRNTHGSVGNPLALPQAFKCAVWQINAVGRAGDNQLDL